MVHLKSRVVSFSRSTGAKSRQKVREEPVFSFSPGWESCSVTCCSHPVSQHPMVTDLGDVVGGVNTDLVNCVQPG